MWSGSRQGWILGSALAGVLLLPISLSAAPPAARPKSGERARQAARVTDAEGKLSFVPPAGWQRAPNAPPPNIIFVAPNEPNESVNIGVISEPVGSLTLELFVQRNKDFAARNRGLIVYNEQSATLAGEKAHAWRMHVKPPQGEAKETRQIFTIHNRRSYILTLAGLPSNIHKYEPIFEKVVASFRWEK